MHDPSLSCCKGRGSRLDDADPLRYAERSSNSLNPSQWTPSAREFDLPVEGAKSEISPFPEESENCFPAGASSISAGADSAQWRSSRRQLFMAKPVYPIIYRNPISEVEDGEEHSPDLESSSGKEDFLPNSAGSRDLGFTEEKIEAENLHEDEDRRCEICGRSMSEKSPWNSCRSSEAAIAAVLPCGDIFHAECLEETTPWTRIRDPPCPICEEGFVFSRPLEEALRCARRRRRTGGAALVPPRIAGGRGRYGSLLKDSFKRGCRLRSWGGFWGKKKRVVGWFD